MIPVAVPDDDGAFAPDSLRAFKETMDRLKSQGITTKAVIVCNPHNPLGRTYPRETLLAYARFCEEEDLHLVCDEIFALSVYDNPDFPEALPFTSMLSLDVEKELGMRFNKARLHVTYGMSKDFCSNGLRIGCLVSQNNPSLFRAMEPLSFLMRGKCSTLSLNNSKS